MRYYSEIPLVEGLRGESVREGGSGLGPLLRDSESVRWLDVKALKRHVLSMAKATLYLEDPIHKALRLKAAETRQTMSELVNEALKSSLLEDLDDIETWKERRDDGVMDFEEFVTALKKDGTL